MVTRKDGKQGMLKDTPSDDRVAISLGMQVVVDLVTSLAQMLRNLRYHRLTREDIISDNLKDIEEATNMEMQLGTKEGTLSDTDTHESHESRDASIFAFLETTFLDIPNPLVKDDIGESLYG